MKQSHFRLLVVEDCIVNQRLIKDTIRYYNKNIEVYVANNGQQAVEMLSDEDFDLVLMDIRMPVLNGIEATKKIRKTFEEPKRNIPIIGLTAHSAHEEKQNCIDAGMNDYMLKPFDIKELFEKMRNFLDFESKEESVPNKTIKQSENIFNELKHSDLSLLLATYKNNIEKVKRIVGMYLEAIPEQISELIESYNAEDFENAKIMAHSLKSSFRFLGMEYVSTIAQEFENKLAINTDFNFERQINEMNNVWVLAKAELSKIID